MHINTINPILLRELRGRMRTARSFWLLSGFLAMVAGAALLVYTSSYTQSTQINADSDVGRSVFFTLIIFAMIALSFVAPVLAAGSVAGERERQTFDLLLTTQLTVRQIIFGKIIASLSYCFLLLAAMTPLMGIVFLMGSVDMTQLIIMLAVIVSNTVLLTTIGVYWSVRASTPVSAIGFALATVLFILIALPLIISISPSIIMTQGINETIRDLTFHMLFPFHPFIVFFYTDEILRSQQLWGQAFSINGTDIVVPAMWILSICYSWILSVIIVWRTLRRMHISA